jgi:hypothetical protein
LAGSESGAGNPLVADLILFGQKLEQLGFTYYRKGHVVVVGDDYGKPTTLTKKDLAYL